MILVVREITAIVAALMVGGTFFGYLRILLVRSEKSRLVQYFCWSLVLLSGLLIWRMGYASLVGPLEHGHAIVFNIIATVGGLVGLQSQYLMIPREERNKFLIFTAWAYPPSGVLERFVICTSRVTRLWKDQSRDEEEED